MISNYSVSGTNTKQERMSGARVQDPLLPRLAIKVYQIATFYTKLRQPSPACAFFKFIGTPLYRQASAGHAAIVRFTSAFPKLH
jgi:hypothetical protein